MYLMQDIIVDNARGNEKKASGDTILSRKDYTS